MRFMAMPAEAAISILKPKSVKRKIVVKVAKILYDRVFIQHLLSKRKGTGFISLGLSGKAFI